jgi:hypothetical protein
MIPGEEFPPEALGFQAAYQHGNQVQSTGTLSYEELTAHVISVNFRP